MAKKTCFVVMGFGKKTDYQSGRMLDLDKSYQYIIKPAAEDAGLECKRADEIIHSGLIDVPMYDQLLAADVVIADISTGMPMPSTNWACGTPCVPTPRSPSRRTRCHSRLM